MPWQEILQDQEFQTQPFEVKRRVAENYFNEHFLSDPGFNQQTPDVQDRVRQNFLGTIQEGTGGRVTDTFDHVGMETQGSPPPQPPPQIPIQPVKFEPTEEDKRQADKAREAFDAGDLKIETSEQEKRMRQSQQMKFREEPPSRIQETTFERGIIQPTYEIAGGLARAGAETAGLVDFVADQVSKLTGTKKGGFFAEAEEQGKQWAQYFSDNGIKDESTIAKIMKGVYSGLGAATVEVPKLMSVGKILGFLGPSARMPATFGSLGALEGAKEGGLPGAGMGAAQGVLIGEVLKGAQLLPPSQSIPAMFSVGAASPGSLEEKVANGIVFAVLGLGGGEERAKARAIKKAQEKIAQEMKAKAKKEEVQAIPGEEVPEMPKKQPKIIPEEIEIRPPVPSEAKPKPTPEEVEFIKQREMAEREAEGFGEAKQQWEIKNLLKNTSIVDKQNNPLIVYHGTPGKSKYIPGERNILYENKKQKIWDEYNKETEPIFKIKNYHMNQELSTRVDKAVKKREIAIKALGPNPFKGKYKYEEPGFDITELDPRFSGDIGIHFGTEKQAKKFAGEYGKIFPVYLNIKNAVEIPDIFSRYDQYVKAVNTLEGVGALKQGAYRELKIKAEKLEELEAQLNDYRDIGEKSAYKNFWEALKTSIDKSIDGFKYLNEVEDIGQYSYVALNKRQIIPIPQAPSAIPVETRVSQLAKKTTDIAIEEGIKQEFGDLPEYSKMNMPEQAKMAKDLIDKDFDSAYRIGMLMENPKGDLRAGSVFVALREHAIKNNDVALIRDLAHSPLTQKMSALGQEIKALDAMGRINPVKAIQEIERAREKRTETKLRKKKLGDEKKRIASQIKEEIKKARPPKETWTSFVRSLQC